MSKEFRVSQKIFNEAWNLLPAVDRFVDTLSQSKPCGCELGNSLSLTRMPRR